MALHVLGSGDAQASFPQFLHQLRRGVPLNKEIDSHHWVDGLNELQIRERAHLTDDEIVAQLSAVGPRAVEGRWGTPFPMRYLPIPFGPPIGWKPLKYLLDVGFTRPTDGTPKGSATALGGVVLGCAIRVVPTAPPCRVG